LIRIKVAIAFLQASSQLRQHGDEEPMIDQNITDKLTNGVCDWATEAARELRGQRDLMEAFRACLNGATSRSW
jgi:hypothetical protein